MYKLVTESNRPAFPCAGNLEPKIEFYSLDSFPAITRIPDGSGVLHELPGEAGMTSACNATSLLASFYGTGRAAPVSVLEDCAAAADSTVKKPLLDWRRAAFCSSGFDADGEIH